MKVGVIIEKFSRSELIDHIKGLKDDEDRNVNITLGYLSGLSLLIVLAYSLINEPFNLGLFFESKLISIFHFIVIYNIIIALFSSFNMLFRMNTLLGVSSKSYNELDKKSCFLGHMYELLCACLTVFFSIFIFVYFQPISILTKLSIIVFGIRYTFTIREKIKILMNNYIKPSDNKNDITKQGINKISYSFIFIYSSIFIILAAVPISELLKLNNVAIFKMALIFNLCTLIVEVITIYFSHIISISWLCSLEKEIYKSDLNAEKIKDILISTYYNRVQLEIIYYSNSNTEKS